MQPFFIARNLNCKVSWENKWLPLKKKFDSFSGGLEYEKFLNLLAMKNICTLILASMICFACSNSSNGGNNDNGKKAGAPNGKNGRVQRTLNVEGYIAEIGNQGKVFQTMATLLAENSVSLSAAASGHLIMLNAKDGMKVGKGALLAKIDDSELKAQLKQAEANYQLADQKYQRTKNLFEKDGATQQDLEAAEASLKASEASIDLIKAQIEKTEVRAPFSGVLGFVGVSVGAWLSAGAAIAELNEVDKLKAKFSLPQRYSSILNVGDSVSLRDEERNVERMGVVSALDAKISESSRTRQVLVAVDNKQGDLIAGSYTNIKVNLSSSRVPSFTIPAEALILDREGAYVFVDKGGKAQIKYVQTGLRTPISVQVLSGLDQGDTVIVSGIVSLRPGVDVKIRELRHVMKYEVDR